MSFVGQSLMEKNYRGAKAARCCFGEEERGSLGNESPSLLLLLAIPECGMSVILPLSPPHGASPLSAFCSKGLLLTNRPLFILPLG